MSEKVSEHQMKIIRAQIEAKKAEEQQRLKNKFNWETEAVQVIKEKIKHFEETGNKRKLEIYQRKLDSKRPIISKLQRLIK